MNVLQDWVTELPLMQQSVLLSSIRGPDGLDKEHPAKSVVRWLRRCVLISAFDGTAIDRPDLPGGGNFTGPSFVPKGSTAKEIEQWEIGMDKALRDYARISDGVPHHFHMHLIHAAQVLGYKHSNKRIRFWWARAYVHLVNGLSLLPESQEQMDFRLADKEDQWVKSLDK